MYKELKRQAEKVSNEVIHSTQDLIRTPSPSLHEYDVAEKVENLMRELDYDLVLNDDVGNVVGVIVTGDPEFAIVMNSHMDTVEADDLDSWAVPPLSGDIVDGRIFGLGASDCKSGLVSQIYAGRVLASSGLLLRGNIVVAATVAEENGCSVGVRHLLETTLSRVGMVPKFVVLGEPTGLKICYGHDGWVGIDITLTGAAGDVVREAGEHLKQTLGFHCDEQGYPGARSIMTAEGPVTESSDSGFASTIRVYRRLFPGESAGDVLTWLDGVAQKDTAESPGVDLDVHVHEEKQELYTGHKRQISLMTAPWSTNLMNPLVDRARESLLTAGCGWTTERWELDQLRMGTAGALITRGFGLPAVGYGPGEERFAHACNESVGIPQLIDSVFGNAVLMHGLSGAPVLGWH